MYAPALGGGFLALFAVARLVLLWCGAPDRRQPVSGYCGRAYGISSRRRFSAPLLDARHSFRTRHGARLYAAARRESGDRRNAAAFINVAPASQIRDSLEQPRSLAILRVAFPHRQASRRMPRCWRDPGESAPQGVQLTLPAVCFSPTPPQPKDQSPRRRPRPATPALRRTPPCARIGALSRT